MKKKFVQIAALCLSAALLSLSGGRQAASAGSSNTSGRIIRVGLHHDGPYGTGSVEGLNLANKTGSGFRFGYYDSSNRFVQLGFTAETAISVVKTENVYYGTHNGYKSYHSALTTSDAAVGKYYLQLPETYPTFAQAQAAAAAHEDRNGFPACIGGEYFVRIGSYTTRDKAAADQAELAELGVAAEVTETLASGVNVVVTASSTIVFQYDDLGKGTGLGIEPNAPAIPEDGGPDNPEDGGKDNQEDGGPDIAALSAEDGVKYTTWSKNCLYYGGFRFERIGGGNMTVVNILDLEDYVKGVVPHEMSDSWPLEALKAQAVAARSYAVSLGDRHRGSHFDICDNTHCQAYSGQTRAGNNSNAAVDDTAGQVILYNNKVAQAYYYSSNGGASEGVAAVWGSNQADYPYLVGKPDPYEAAAGVNNDYTKTFTAGALAAILRNEGYGEVGASIVSVEIISLTDAGNPKQITFTDNNGEQFTLNTRFVKSMLGLSSFRYGLAPSQASASGVSVNGSAPVDAGRLYAVDGNGNTVSLTGDLYVLTGSGTLPLEQGGTGGGSVSGGVGSLGIATADSGPFTFVGKGWGHNVGMSQWGAYAMAKLEKTYSEILQFYYTDVKVGYM